jgi:glycosyltransferase involved in cell wall biosynthesis
MFILIDTLKLRPRVVNYNLNQGIQAEYYLLLLIKLLAGAKIVTTVHDVIPFSRKNASKFKTAEIFARIFALSDALIFHSDETKTTFQNEYPVYRDKTSYIYPFPPMTFNIDLAPLHSSNNPEVVKFLFIGHIRNEKGVKCMLEAWEQLARAGNNSSLEIAGNTSEYSDLDYLIQTVQSLNNITLDLRYLSDALFIEKIKSCDVVLLPYEQSSNTGLPFIAASYGKQVIASSLPVFEPYVKSSIIQSELIFDCGSSISLLEKLILASNQIKAGDPQPNIKALNDYINHFGRYTRLTYSKLLSLR